MPADRRFPKSFIWGAAAAAPQIEGAAFEDGKGESTWDRFARTSPLVKNHDNLDVACDHYHRYKDDVKLMKSLGMRNYRLSLAWPRIIPGGTGAVNRQGLDFYKRLFDAMHKAGITPWVTLFHWDTPYSLEEAGGWRNRATAEAYGKFAEVAVAALKDHVKHWFTLNEIRCFTEYCYSGGLRMPPGINETPQVVNQTIHHALLAHGYGVQAVREHGGKGAKVGLVENLACTIPLTETPADIAAAREAFLDRNCNILEVLSTGAYGARYRRLKGKDAAIVAKGDLALISQKTDFLGLNIYTAEFLRAPKRGSAVAKAKAKYEAIQFTPEYPAYTDIGWLKPTPQVMYWAPKFTADCYAWKDLYITENGIGSMTEKPNAQGEIHDLFRREYYRSYLTELHRGISDKVPMRGYFAWSIMDNYEWADGYTTRFGLCYTDYATQQRTPKLSAEWYATVMRENRVV